MRFLKARLSVATRVSLLLLLASCSSVDVPTAPPEASPVLSLSADRKAEHELLEAQRKALKEQFKAEREARREEFKAARERWKLLKREVKALKKTGGILSTELLSCEPREFSGDAEIIGPAGGSLKIGSHTLSIPKGALDRDVLVSGQAPVSDRAEVELQPHGLVFNRSVQLSLDYSNCIQPPDWMKVFIVYLGGQDQILEVTVSRDKKGIKEVTGDLDHFSRYAVAW